MPGRFGLGLKQAAAETTASKPRGLTTSFSAQVFAAYGLPVR
jgi:hypothetical protein